MQHLLQHSTPSGQRVLGGAVTSFSSFALPAAAAASSSPIAVPVTSHRRRARGTTSRAVSTITHPSRRRTHDPSSMLSTSPPSSASPPSTSSLPSDRRFLQSSSNTTTDHSSPTRRHLAVASGAVVVAAAYGYYAWREPVQVITSSEEAMPSWQADQILRKEEFVDVPVMENPGSLVVRADVDLLPSNDPIEDRYTANVIRDGDVEGIMFGVFDGHWDGHCADLVTAQLPSYIASFLSGVDSEFTAQDQPPSSNHRIQKVKKALSDAFVRLDEDLLSLPLKAIPNFEKLTPAEITSLPEEVRLKARNAILPALTGSCGVLTYVEDRDLYVANAGDSRAVLGIRTNDGWEAAPLTEDHQPSNPSELARLKAEHPGEEETVAYRRSPTGPLRVVGGMMPTRSFGDGKFKWPLEWHSKIDALLASVPRHKHVFSTSKHCFTPPYMTAKPDVTYRKISDHDRFVVIASDGVFDRLSNVDVVAAIAQYMETTNGDRADSIHVHEPNMVIDKDDVLTPSSIPKHNLLPTVRDANAATHVVRTALAGGKGDAETSRMLSLPFNTRRKWRDDMTVVVVFFRGSVPQDGITEKHDIKTTALGNVDVNIEIGLSQTKT